MPENTEMPKSVAAVDPRHLQRALNLAERSLEVLGQDWRAGFNLTLQAEFGVELAFVLFHRVVALVALMGPARGAEPDLLLDPAAIFAAAQAPLAPDGGFHLAKFLELAKRHQKAREASAN